MAMRLLDLFAGLGGFSLAAKWMNWETVAFVEKDPFCQRVLRKNFGQDIEIHDDITTFSGEPFRGRVDIVTGGFPCQPYSVAGKQQGTADVRHLWPEMFRTIVESQADFVVGENVLGLINWSGGLVFEQVQSDLESAGYAVWAGIIPACGKNAPHRRDRLWIVAYSRSGGRKGGEQGMHTPHPHRYDTTYMSPISFPGHRNGNGFPSPRILRSGDGFPDRMDRIKSLGNSIVPQIALEIFKAIDRTVRELH